MKKKIIVMAIASFATIAGWNISKSETGSKISQVILSEIEALAGCETSSNPSANVGTCSSMVGGGGDVCVAPGSSCSGNH